MAKMSDTVNCLKVLEFRQGKDNWWTRHVDQGLRQPKQAETLQPPEEPNMIKMDKTEEPALKAKQLKDNSLELPAGKTTNETII